MCPRLKPKICLTVFNFKMANYGQKLKLKIIWDNQLFCECFEMEYEYLKNTVLLFCKRKKNRFVGIKNKERLTRASLIL